MKFMHVPIKFLRLRLVLFLCYFFIPDSGKTVVGHCGENKDGEKYGQKMAKKKRLFTVALAN